MPAMCHWDARRRRAAKTRPNICPKNRSIAFFESSRIRATSPCSASSIIEACALPKSGSCATHLLNLELSIEDVQDHLGHANIQSTLHYAKYSAKRRALKDQRLRDW